MCFERKTYKTRKERDSFEYFVNLSTTQCSNTKIAHNL